MTKMIAIVSEKIKKKSILITGGADGRVSIYDLIDDLIGSNNNSSSDKNNINNQQQKVELKPIVCIQRKSLNENGARGIWSVQWYPNDTGMFFTGSIDGAVEVWDTNREDVSMQFDVETCVNAIDFSQVQSSNLLIAAATNDQKGRLCDLRSGKSTHCLSGHREGLLAIKWSPYSSHLIATGSRDFTIRLWDIRRSDTFLLALDQHNGSGMDSGQVSAVVNPTISTAAAASGGNGGGTSRKYSQKRSYSGNNKYNINTGKGSTLRRDHNNMGSPNLTIRKDVPRAHNGMVTSILWTPDGNHLVSTGADSKIRLWDMQTGVNTLVDYRNAHNSHGTANQMALSTDGKYLFHPNGKNINVYNTKTGELVKYLKGHFERVNCCIFHPTQEILYSGSNDQLILVWDRSMVDKIEDDQYKIDTQSNIQENNVIRDNDDDDDDILNNRNVTGTTTTTTTTTNNGPLPDEDRWSDDEEDNSNNNSNNNNRNRGGFRGNGD
eukprot:gene2572-3186_t